jgi:hypothetical protein
MAAGSGVTTYGTAAGFWDVPVYNALVPKEGPKVVVLQLPLNVYAQANIDLSLTNMLQRISVVQSLYVDNYDASTALYVNILDSQQRIVVPPGMQGYFPAFVPKGAKMQFLSQAGLIITVHLCNVPVPAGNWLNPTYAG